MKTNLTSKIIRWIARITSILIGGTILLLFITTLLTDLINVVRGQPLELEGFFAGGVYNFFTKAFPAFIFFGLLITGYICYWFSEKRGVVFTLIGGISICFFLLILTLLKDDFQISGFESVFMFLIQVFLLPVILTLPSLLIILARHLEKT